MMVTVTPLGLCSVFWLVCSIMAFPNPACVLLVGSLTAMVGCAMQVAMTDCLEIHIGCHRGLYAL